MPPQVSLRKFPYPYKCALALSNDLEYLTPKAFWDIHRFLNTTETTAMGPGLGLQVTDSLFMYSADQKRSYSYFQGTSATPSAHAPWLRELMQLGCIDVLHSYGDFSWIGGFKRPMAERALEELERHNIHLRVWTNHGSVEDTQNVGASQAYYQMGDLPGSPEYHTDLTMAYGFRFFWLDFNATNMVGQDRATVRKDAWREIVATKRWRPGGVREVFRQHKGNRLLKTETLRDGRKAYLFQRYRGPKRPDPASLPDQLSQANMDTLKASQGYMVVYQHLGCDRRQDGGCNCNASPYFTPEVIAAFQRLADRYHAGEVFVTGVAKLLTYRMVTQGLRWKVAQSQQAETVITIQEVDDPVIGRFVPTLEDLHGVTFYTASANRTKVVLTTPEGGQREVRVSKNSKDATGRESVTVPVQIWKLPETPSARVLGN